MPSHSWNKSWRDIRSGWRGRLTPGGNAVAAVPLLWLALFFGLPFLTILRISLSEAVIGLPPYSALLEWVEGGTLSIRLYLANFALLWQDSLYLDAFANSVKIAAVATLLCLLLGYPMALAITHVREGLRTPLLLLVILPFWTSFLIRVYAWIRILKGNGLINSLLLWLGLIDEPLQLLHTDLAVYIGIVYAYLPFMVLPLYATLSRLDGSLLEAAADLLGGPDSLVIGKVLWTEFFSNRDWPVAAAVAVALLALLVVPVMLFERFCERGNGA